MPVLIGTSGWQYRHWRDTFYPRDVPQRLWLEYYAARFDTVEVNNAFYRLPDADVFAAWARRTPDDFVVAVKMSRYLTHIKRLKDPAEPVGRFFEHARCLGNKLGPVLVQLPPRFGVDVARLADTLERFPKGVRAAVEFRDDSWFCDEVRALLERHDAAFCVADSIRRSTPVWRTASWGYVRFHEGGGRPSSCYRRDQLKQWAERLAADWTPDDDVFVFFNNDGHACALHDAAWFAEEVAGVGLRPTSVAPLDDVTLGE